MAQAARAVVTVICVSALCVVLIGALHQPTGGPPPLAYYVAPVQAAQVATAQLSAQTEQARIAAALEANRAQQRTVRLAIICAGVALTIVGAAVLLQLVRHAQPPVIVLLPTDARFNAALHDLGGVRVNGVPMLEGRVVDCIETDAIER